MLKSFPKIDSPLVRGLAFAVCLFGAANFAKGQQESPVQTSIPLWNGDVPGIITAKGQERDTTGPDGRLVAGQPVVRLGDVSEPTLTVYPADEQNNTAALRSWFVREEAITFWPMTWREVRFASG